jgi:DNA-binding response OmpR family regulator
MITGDGGQVVRVLLIEDDSRLGAQLVQTLSSAGYDVRWQQDGQSREVESEVRLVVLDLMLPGQSGLDWLRTFRPTADVPVLVLSARADPQTRVQALRLGADDYLVKPFWPEELLERVRARLRRPALAREPTLRLGALAVDLVERRVCLGDEEVHLTPTEFALLAALARRPGAAVTRGALVDAALDGEREGALRALDVHISRLRRKLGAEVVETVWGVGYRLGVP